MYSKNLFLWKFHFSTVTCYTCTFQLLILQDPDGVLTHPLIREHMLNLTYCRYAVNGCSTELMTILQDSTFRVGWLKRSHSRVIANVEKAGASDPDDPGGFDRGGRHHDPQ